MDDKNLELWINVKFCVKIGKSVSEILALLAFAYDEYAMKKQNVSKWHRIFKEGREDEQMSRKVGSQKRKGQMEM
jgi:hypothetical protein